MNLLGIKAPTTLAEAVSLMDQHEDAAAYAGGTELLLVMKQGFLQPSWLVDVKGIPELRRIELDEEGGRLRIGAAVTHREVTRDEGIRRVVPELAEVESRIANARVRASGTIGGNLCFAEPHSDIATFALLLDGVVGLHAKDGSREVPLQEFIVGPYDTARQPDEVMTHLELALPASGAYIGYERLAIHERPSVIAGMRVNVDAANERIDDVRVVVGAVGPVPSRVPEAEDVLAGATVADFPRAVIDAAEAAARSVVVLEDLTGSEDYKRHLVGVLLERAGEQVWAKLQRGDDS